MKRLIAFFKEPPAWFALLWALLTGGMIVLSAAVSTSGAKEEPFAAVLYGFTALSLSYAIYAIVRWVPKVKLAAKTRLSRNKYAGTFLASYTVRTVVYSRFRRSSTLPTSSSTASRRSAIVPFGTMPSPRTTSRSWSSASLSSSARGRG